jgi:hypothetical protein
VPFDIEQHVRYAIANAQMRYYPFAHIFAQNVFPEDFYREFLTRLPGGDRYTPINQTGTVDKDGSHERHVLDLDALVEQEQAATGGAGFWAALEEWLMSERFMGLVVDKFQPAIQERFGAGAKMQLSNDCRFVRDFARYAITPHTDQRDKLVSLLFYLPADDSRRHLGTSIYLPRDAGFASDGSVAYKPHVFRHIARMDYVPNSLFAFVRTDRSFHGVEPIEDADVERNLMLYNIYVPKVEVPAQRAKPAGFRWPWQAR